MKPVKTAPAAIFPALLLMFLCLRCGIVLAAPIDNAFEQARKGYYATVSLPSAQQPAALKQSIQDFRKIIEKDARGKYIGKCLYLIAQCYHRLYDATPSKEYLWAAQKYYRLLVNDMPDDPLADDAQYLLGIIYLDEDPAQAYLEFSKVGIYFPKGDMRERAIEKATQLKKQLASKQEAKEPAKAQPAPAFAFASGSAAEPSLPSNSPSPEPAPTAGPKLTELTSIQHWTGKDYTRVALYVSEPVVFERHDLPAEPKIGLPDRIYVDLKNCRLNAHVSRNTSIRDRLLRRVRIVQYDPTQARVALDIDSMKSYKIFSLADPYRVIIDVQGVPAETVKQAPAPKPLATPKEIAAPKEIPAPEATTPPRTVTIPNGSQTSTLARQLGLHVGRIVIDPGHGGKDKGAISPNGLYEKDIALEIAKRLKRNLELTTGCKVVLTRTDDRYLSLEERTAIANTQKADLFISVHTNAHDDQTLHGTETYFLNLSNDAESARVAALENATSTRRISDLETILKDIMLNTKINESAKLARTVQSNIIHALASKYRDTRDLGVKQAPFYVLLGAEMPSVLIEAAFITNKVEEQRLKDSNFQRSLVAGIASGIGSYIKQMRQFADVGGAQ